MRQKSTAIADNRARCFRQQASRSLSNNEAIRS